MPVPNNLNFIPISQTFARYIIQRGSRLVSDGLGREWNPGDNSYDINSNEHGFLDEIPMEDGPLWYWANAMVQMLRLIVAAMNHAMLEDSDPTSVVTDINEL
jgi:hypothetical protein